MRRLVALGCLIALLPLGAGAVPPGPIARLPDEARDRFAAALAASRAGDWGAAAGEFGDPAWAATPLAEYALLFRAENLLRAGDGTGARAAAAQAAAAAPDNALVPSALLAAAAVLSGAGDEAGAAALLRRFLDRHADHPEAPRARYALGQALLAGGRLREALRAFHEVWILAPASPFAEGAAEQLRALAEGGLARPIPTQRERLDRAERLLAAGLDAPARAEAEALAAEKPASELLLRALRVVMDAARKAGRDDAAIAAANRGLLSAPAERRPSWLFELARLLQRRGGGLALPMLDRLVREHPKSAEAPEALLLKARLLEGAGKSAQSEAVYLKLAADYPDDEAAGAALWRLGWLAWLRGSHPEAAALWGRLLQIRGGQSHRDAATYWLGRAQEQRGQREAAARHFARLLHEAPRSYYGILAARRHAAAAAPRPSSPAAAPRPPSPAAALPADPLETLQVDARYARVEALRAVGLGEFADEEMEDMTRRALGDPGRLYALSAAYAQGARYHLALRILRRHFQSVARSGLPSAPRAFWELFYPIGWRAELTDAAGRAEVDPFLVAAVVREESSFHPQARSRAGARGLMQLMPETARSMAQVRRLAFSGRDLLDEPGANLQMGTTFLSALLREFGDARLAAAAYNAGPARLREWWRARRSDDLEVFVEQIPFNETRAFVKRVMLSWDEYRRVYAPPPPTAGPEAAPAGAARQ